MAAQWREVNNQQDQEEPQGGVEQSWEQRDNVQERMEGVEEEAQERVVRDEGEDQVRNGMHLNNCLLKNCVINFHFSK